MRQSMKNKFIYKREVLKKLEEGKDVYAIDWEKAYIYALKYSEVDELFDILNCPTEDRFLFYIKDGDSK